MNALNTVSFSLILIFSVLLSGCSFKRTPLTKPAQDSLSLGSRFDYEVENQPQPVPYVKFYEEASLGADKKAARNRITFDLMNLVDEEYKANEVNIRFERATKDFVVSLTSIALTGVASQAGESLSNLLAAIDTGVKGVNATFDKAYLEDQTNTLLFSAMRQARAEIRAEIYARLDNDVSVYPLEAAAHDITRYYRSGFVTTALINLAEESGANAKIKEDEAAKILSDLE